MAHGDLVSRLTTPVSRILTPLIPIIRLLTKSHDPPSRVVGLGFKPSSSTVLGDS